MGNFISTFFVTLRGQDPGLQAFYDNSSAIENKNLKYATFKTTRPRECRYSPIERSSLRTLRTSLPTSNPHSSRQERDSQHEASIPSVFSLLVSKRLSSPDSFRALIGVVTRIQQFLSHPSVVDLYLLWRPRGWTPKFSH